MRSIREQFIPFLSQILEPFAPIEKPFSIEEERKDTTQAPEPRSALNRLYEWMNDPKHRRSALSVLWVFLVVGVAFGAGMLWYLARIRGWANTVPALGTAILCGLLFGVAVLFFLPSKTVITIWGCLLGTSLDKAVTGTGILKSASKAIADSASLLAQGASFDEQVTRLALWVFVATFGVICLPAFFRD